MENKSKLLTNNKEKSKNSLFKEHSTLPRAGGPDKTLGLGSGQNSFQVKVKVIRKQ